jgi:hypothetical protein
LRDLEHRNRERERARERERERDRERERERERQRERFVCTLTKVAKSIVVYHGGFSTERGKRENVSREKQETSAERSYLSRTREEHVKIDKNPEKETTIERDSRQQERFVTSSSRGRRGATLSELESRK